MSRQHRLIGLAQLAYLTAHSTVEKLKPLQMIHYVEISLMLQFVCKRQGFDCVLSTSSDFV